MCERLGEGREKTKRTGQNNKPHAPTPSYASDELVSDSFRIGRNIKQKLDNTPVLLIVDSLLVLVALLTLALICVLLLAIRLLAILLLLAIGLLAGLALLLTILLLLSVLLLSVGLLSVRLLVSHCRERRVRVKE